MDTLVDQYGYDDSLFTTEPQDFLHCPICTLVLRDPVQILCCGHKFCSVCFNRIKTDAINKNKELLCPVDRDVVDLTEVRDDVAMRRMIGNLQVRCPHHEHGCTWVGDLRNMEEHYEGCEFQPIGERGEAAVLTVEQLNSVFERLDQYEAGLIQKDKEIAALRLEQQQTKDDIATLKQQLDEMVVLNEVNADLGQKMVQLMKEVEEHRNLHKEHQQQHQHQQQTIDELSLRLLTLEKRCETGVGGEKYEGEVVSATAASNEGPKTPLSGFAASKKKETNNKKTKKKEVVVQHHCGYVSKVTINNHTVTFHAGGSCYKTVSAPVAVVPPRTKVWYEVEYTRCGGSDWNIVGWTTPNLPTSQTDVGEYVGSGDHSYGFRPLAAYKYHNNTVRQWGRKLEGVKGFVGVALDLVRGEVLFSVEGQWTSPMGVAFTGVPTDQEFFPAITGNGATILKFNFGDRPFRYGPPDPTFEKLVDTL